MEKRPAEAFGGDFADLLYLYRLVRKHKPRVVVEFGSGCSTVVLAQALFEEARASGKAPGRLVALESSEHWQRVTASSIPEYLEEICDIRHAPVEVVEYKGERVFRHLNVPRTAIDMLYLDSPALSENVRVAVDPVVLEDQFSRYFVGLIDGRVENVEFLKTNLKAKYRFQDNFLLGNTLFQRLLQPLVPDRTYEVHERL